MEKDNKTNYGAEEMCIGLCFSCVIGASGVIDLTVWMKPTLPAGLFIR